MPTFLKGYERVEDQPIWDDVAHAYLIAYNRMSPQSPIPVSEIVSYHHEFELAYSVDSTVDIIRSLESDDMQKKLKKSNG